MPKIGADIGVIDGIVFVIFIAVIVSWYHNLSLLLFLFQLLLFIAFFVGTRVVAAANAVAAAVVLNVLSDLCCSCCF